MRQLGDLALLLGFKEFAVSMYRLAAQVGGKGRGCGTVWAIRFKEAARCEEHGVRRRYSVGRQHGVRRRCSVSRPYTAARRYGATGCQSSGPSITWAFRLWRLPFIHCGFRGLSLSFIVVFGGWVFHSLWFSGVWHSPLFPLAVFVFFVFFQLLWLLSYRAFLMLSCSRPSAGLLGGTPQQVVRRRGGEGRPGVRRRCAQVAMQEGLVA